MKRWIACLLSLCLCVTPVLAGAQSISTEALLGQLLGRFAAQLESPSLGMTAKMPEEMFDLCFALDEQGFPDLSFGVQGKWGAVRYDADASGLRFDDGVKKVGVTIETLLRVLNADENGVKKVDETKCVGCGACAAACPWHMPTINPETKKSTKCVQCGACAAGCVTGALKIVPWEAIAAASQAV